MAPLATLSAASATSQVQEKKRKTAKA
jgi:hypothetical protein